VDLLPQLLWQPSRDLTTRCREVTANLRALKLRSASSQRYKGYATADSRTDGARVTRAVLLCWSRTMRLWSWSEQRSTGRSLLSRSVQAAILFGGSWFADSRLARQVISSKASIEHEALPYRPSTEGVKASLGAQANLCGAIRELLVRELAVVSGQTTADATTAAKRLASCDEVLGTHSVPFSPQANYTD
jgi:hypothetical protein